MKKIISMALVLCMLFAITVYCDTEPETIELEMATLTETKTEEEETQLCQELINTPEPITPLKSLGVYKITAYCPCYRCCGKTNGITASGVKAVEGVTAAADSRFPFGTKLYIDGHEYIVQDRGGAIKGNKIDVFFADHQSAINFGVQYKEVFSEK